MGNLCWVREHLIQFPCSFLHRQTAQFDLEGMWPFIGHWTESNKIRVLWRLSNVRLLFVPPKRPPAQWYYNTFHLLRLNTKVFDVYLVMRYGLYVICLVVLSHAKLRMYITASNQYNYVTCWTQFLSLTGLVRLFLSRCHKLIPHSTVQRLALWHPPDGLDIYALLYIYCLLMRTIFHTWMSCGFFYNEFTYWIHVFSCYNRVCFKAQNKISKLYSPLWKLGYAVA
jgi:hypothetical protein